MKTVLCVIYVVLKFRVIGFTAYFIKNDRINF